MCWAAEILMVRENCVAIFFFTVRRHWYVFYGHRMERDIIQLELVLSPEILRLIDVSISGGHSPARSKLTTLEVVGRNLS